MSAGNYTWKIPQGTYQERIFTYSDSTGAPFNLTNMTAKMQIRPYKGSSTAMATLTTENGGIILGGTEGTVRVIIRTAQTSAISSDGYYDIELIDADGEVDRFLEGAVLLNPETTI
jgi:hypothetical protein